MVGRMSEQPQQKVGQSVDGSESAQQLGPRLAILAQYIKDLSFENPRGPGGFAQAQGRPEIQIRVDVRGERRGEEQHEVVLELTVDARLGDQPVFLIELSYGGIFLLQNIPPDALQALLMIECPRLLFPFARRIVADLTRDGGFPPLLLDPIDFVSLYRRRLQQQAAQSPAGTA
jgi:preprotein translocase subunit SecB